MTGLQNLSCLVLLLLLISAPTRATAFPRPPWRKHALMTRWLAHEAAYGVLSTVGGGGAPVGGVVSVADGAGASPAPTRAARNDDPTPAPPPAPAPATVGGRLFMYLSPMDELTQNLAKDPRVSLTVTQAATADGCGATDPEDPTCARASFLGEAVRLAAADAEAAKSALFERHPAMRGWPDDHSFAAWEVVVREAHLLDFYGGMAVVPAADYYGEQVPATAPSPGARGAGGEQGREARRPAAAVVAVA